MRDLGWADEVDGFLEKQADHMADAVDTRIRDTHLTYTIREVVTADFVERTAESADKLAQAMNQMANAAGVSRNKIEQAMMAMQTAGGIDYATIGERARRERGAAQARAFTPADLHQVKGEPNREGRRHRERQIKAQARRERRAGLR